MMWIYFSFFLENWSNVDISQGYMFLITQMLSGLVEEIAILKCLSVLYYDGQNPEILIPTISLHLELMHK